MFRTSVLESDGDLQQARGIVLERLSFSRPSGFHQTISHVLRIDIIVKDGPKTTVVTIQSDSLYDSIQIQTFRALMIEVYKTLKLGLHCRLFSSVAFYLWPVHTCR